MEVDQNYIATKQKMIENDEKAHERFIRDETAWHDRR
jgi:hypothetical protein